jgi:hypothetical protein
MVVGMHVGVRSCEPNLVVQSVMSGQGCLSHHYVCLFAQQMIYPVRSHPPCR